MFLPRGVALKPSWVPFLTGFFDLKSIFHTFIFPSMMSVMLMVLTRYLVRRTRRRVISFVAFTLLGKWYVSSSPRPRIFSTHSTPCIIEWS
jgi:hypothetical protein